MDWNPDLTHIKPISKERKFTYEEQDEDKEIHRKVTQKHVVSADDRRKDEERYVGLDDTHEIVLITVEEKCT